MFTMSSESISRGALFKTTGLLHPDDLHSRPLDVESHPIRAPHVSHRLPMSDALFVDETPSCSTYKNFYFFFFSLLILFISFDPSTPMQFLRPFSTIVKRPRYSPEAEAILKDTMVPGPLLKYLKTKKDKKKTTEAASPMYTEPARSLSAEESGPTVAQERLAERVQRALSTVHSIEDLPTPFLTQMSIRSIKVSRNLKRCQIDYETLSDNKKERVRKKE